MARIGRIGSRVALVCVVLVAAGWRAPGVVDQPAPLELRVDGTARQAVAGSTLADAVRDLGLKPRPGDLVDVGGVTIAAGRYPGHVLVNGVSLPGGQRLRSGDRLRLVPGPDHTEPVTTRRVPVPGGEPADPEYTLGRVPGDEVTVRGNISGKVASSAFRPTGPPELPQAVALTFDDGPWGTQTMRILAILRRLHARATFFTVGDLAARYPGIIKAEDRQRGVIVEDHSWSHPLTPPFGEQRPGVVRMQIEQARRTLISEGVAPTLFRPPGGGWSDRVVAIASSLDCRVVLWSVDPRDWAPGRTAKGIARSVLSHVGPGSIVIMHDGGGNRTATIRALPRIIRGIRHMGLRLVTVEE
ncbi:MAG TPA: polysaccharide deacetylase family protein [Gaiellales bacterium]|jgi:peptidoglycan/xylan/chitin deacetylase (PgdA/CDA1 family)/sulfur carrier protein ThiS